MQEGKVLMLEDIADSALLYSKVLQSESFHVKVAEESKKAVRILKEYDIDIIISDVNLAGTNGLEFIGVFKQINPLAEVIMLTA